MIVFDDIVADMIRNKRPHPIVIELFGRDWKLNIFLVFIAQSNFHVPKYVRLKPAKDSRQR